MNQETRDNSESNNPAHEQPDIIEEEQVRAPIIRRDPEALIGNLANDQDMMNQLDEALI